MEASNYVYIFTCRSRSLPGHMIIIGKPENKSQRLIFFKKENKIKYLTHWVNKDEIILK